MSKILLAGDGWGAKAALDSLKHTKDHSLYILTNSEEWKESLTKDGYNLVSDFTSDYDLIITAGWRPIIKKDILQKKIILNIHYSLLPAYRGMHSTVWAILNNEPKLGFTIHRVNEFIDDGPIVYQYETTNNYNDSAAFYMNHFNRKTEEILLTVADDYLRGKIPEIEQDKSKASWVGRRKLIHCAIDFTKSLEYQKAFFRALSNPYPFPYFELKENIFEVHQAAFHQSNVNTDKGRILNIDNEGVWISCDGGYIICKKIILRPDMENVPYSFFKIGQAVSTAQSL